MALSLGGATATSTGTGSADVTRASLASRHQLTPTRIPSPAPRQGLLRRPAAVTAAPLRRAATARASAGAGPVVAAASTMEKVDFKKLQNGSDIRGVAVEGVEGEAVNLTPAVAEAISAGFGRFLAEKKGKALKELSVSVGHDSRVTAQTLREAVARGLAGQGVTPVLFGLASTPAMFNSTISDAPHLHCPTDGAIMITASHLPFNRNGLKFFTSAGGASKADISRILALAEEEYAALTPDAIAAHEGAAAGLTKTADYMAQYAADLVEAVRRGAGGVERPLEGFHIVVDAGNGAGGYFAGSVLEPLGAKTTGSQFLEPDGMFPNHIPNPEDKKAIEAMKRCVLDNKADLGVIFDTDVDRAAAVDTAGKEINRNRLIALMAAIVLEQHPNTTVVTDSVTSDGLTTFIEKLGGKHLRFKRGYKNVIDEGVRLNTAGEECHLAIETSGHGALKENHWLDDGAYLMVKLLVKLAAAAAAGGAKGSAVLTDMISSLTELDVETEVRFKIDQAHPDVVALGGFRAYGEKVLAALDEAVAGNKDLVKAPVNHEGIRVSGYGGWFLLRLSLHDPVLPLNIEGPTLADAKKLGEAVLAVASKFPALDTSPLQKFLSS